MRVAVIGAGNWGRNLVRTFYNLGVLKAVAEADLERCRKISKEYPEVSVYNNYLDLLKSDIPAVAIATPAHTHYKLALEALQADKDVFVEKPLTLTASEAEELTRFAENKGLILMVGHLLLYQPAIQHIKNCIESDIIGKVYNLHQERLKLGRVRSVENVLWSFGVHDLAVLLYLVGQQPEEIQVVGQCAIQPKIEDDVYLHMHFRDGVKAHLHTAWLWPEQQRRLTVVGSRGMLVYNELEQVVTLHRKGIAPDLSNRDQGSEVLFRGSEEPLVLECEHFLNSVSARRLPLSDGRSATQVVRILEQAAQILERGGRK